MSANKSLFSLDSLYILIGNHQINAHEFSQEHTFIAIPENCQSSQIFEETLDIIKRLSNWNWQLKELLYHTASPESVFNHLATIIEAPYFLIDDVNQIYLSSDCPNYPNYNNKIFHTKVSDLLEDSEYRSMIWQTSAYLFPQQPYHERFLCFNIFEQSRLVFRLLLLITDSPEQPAPGLFKLFELFSTALKEVCLAPAGISAIRHQDDRLHLFLKQLISGNDSTNSELIRPILDPYCWELNHFFQILHLQFFEGSSWESVITYICNQLESAFPHSCAVRSNDNILIINNLSLSEPSDNKIFLSRLAPLIRDYTCKAGISDPFDFLLNLKTYHLQALTALEIGQKHNPDFWYYQFADFKLSYLRRKLTEDFSAEMLLPPGFQALLVSDFKNQTEYLKTLSAYLEQRNNISAAAESLFIHRTTFIRRLERIEKLSGMDLTDPQTVFWIGLALFMLLEKQ
ncbi:helix-turn-helix domain-containing protein [Eubacteriaceae bacterium ES2]|nr:helix-turn-helix domain-containing protein [Eubacteriaceae bacterium ES2]